MATQNLIQLLASGLRDLDGGVLAGGKVYHYEPGTTTKKAIYEDDLAAVESAQPIILDSRGCAKVYGTGLYDLVVQASDGSGIESFSTLNAGDAPGSLTAAGLLTLIKTVDGATSGLDADLLDGNHASTFLTAATYTAADILSKLLTVDGTGSGLDADKLDGVEGSGYATAAQGAKADTALQAADASTILTAIKTVDGTGSGLDADLLDGEHSTAFAAANHAHAFDDLSDVTLTTPASGQFLQFNGSAWVNTASLPGSLEDVIEMTYISSNGNYHTFVAAIPNGTKFAVIPQTYRYADGVSPYLPDCETGVMGQEGVGLVFYASQSDATSNINPIKPLATNYGYLIATSEITHLNFVTSNARDADVYSKTNGTGAMPPMRIVKFSA